MSYVIYYSISGIQPSTIKTRPYQFPPQCAEYVSLRQLMSSQYQSWKIGTNHMQTHATHTRMHTHTHTHAPELEVFLTTNALLNHTKKVSSQDPQIFRLRRSSDRLGALSMNGLDWPTCPATIARRNTKVACRTSWGWPPSSMSFTANHNTCTAFWSSKEGKVAHRHVPPNEWIPTSITYSFQLLGRNNLVQFSHCTQPLW